MFDWLFGNKYKKLEEKTEKGFFSVKKDMGTVGKWIKHLDNKDKQLFDLLEEMQRDLSSIKSEIESVREGVGMMNLAKEDKQLLKNSSVYSKQTPVYGVENAVQTAVQTGNFYDILKNLTANERLIVFTLMNSELKLSYEDLALLLGKERSTIRGQINAIKQKSESLIREFSEKNGKKRVFVPEETREKLVKYAKVRVNKKRKNEEETKQEQKNES